MFLNGFCDTMKAEKHYTLLIKAECSSKNGAEDIYFYSLKQRITDSAKQIILRAARKYLNDPNAYIDSIFVYWTRR